MSDDRVMRAAALLLEARRTGRGAIDLPADCRPRSNDEACAIQDAVARQLGPIAGWKTGAPSPTSASAYAPIFTVIASPARFPAATQRLFGIEAEVAFRFARDLPARAEPYGRAEVVAEIASMHPAIELVDSRFADWTRADGLARLADNQSNGALIYGPPVPGWQELDLVRPPIVITAAGIAIGKTKGNNGGDPLRMVTDLVNYCAATQGGLRAGVMVTSGSITGIDFAKAGDRVVAEFGPLGQVELTFPVDGE
jgi:2-keto-4-pentenoate hydratase